MKIGTIYTLYGRRAGAELYFEKILNGLLQKYPAISFIIFCNEEAYHALPEDGPRLKKRVIKWLNNQFLKTLWLELFSKKIVEKESADVFWIHSGTNNFPGKWVIPAVVTFHDLGEYFVKNKYDFLRTFYRKVICIPRSIRRAAVITAVSNTTANDLKSIFNLKKFPLVIYSGSSPREKEAGSFNDSPVEVIEKETSIHLDQIIYCPGRTDYEGKGLDLILKAYKQFNLKTKDAPPLVLSGPRGIKHEKFERDIRKLQLKNKVYWLGRVSNRCVEALYQISKMVIIASRYEGFGFPVLEAMQQRVPVICSTAGALPETAGDAALFFKTGDTSDLLRCMFLLHQNDDLKKRLVEAGESRLKEFNWETTFSQMHKIFLSIGTRKETNDMTC